MHRRLLAFLAATLAAGTVLAGCSSDDGATSDSSVPVALVAPTPDCQSPQVLDALGLTPAPGRAATVSSSATPHPDAPAVGTVPDSFVVTSVLECTPGGWLTDAGGTWSSVQSLRLEGDTAPLVKALALPSGADGEQSTCDHPPVQLWLVDALGRAVRAWVPVGACGGGPRSEVSAALATLTVTDKASFPVALLAPSPSPTP